MDAQQEMFSVLLTALKKEFGANVYDTFLPADDTPYPFVYLAANTQENTLVKGGTVGEITQTIHVWHNNPRKRGTVSDMLKKIKRISFVVECTEHYSWSLVQMSQKIEPDTSTSQPLLHGILQLTFKFG